MRSLVTPGVRWSGGRSWVRSAAGRAAMTIDNRVELGAAQPAGPRPVGLRVTALRDGAPAPDRRPGRPVERQRADGGRVLAPRREV